MSTATDNHESQKSELPVFIIGAGSCGLAIANGLKNANIPYKVFERDLSVKPDSTRARDWAIACHWSIPILASLIGDAKWARIMEAQTDPTTPTKDLDVIKALNGATGEVLNELPFPTFYRFLRSRLRALMSEGIDLSCGKKLTSLSYGDGAVTAHFEDGTSERGRLVVGADGSNSRVRSLLLGGGDDNNNNNTSDPSVGQLKRLPFSATFINASFPRERALFLRSYHPLATVIMHPDNMLGMMAALDTPDPDRPEGWRFTFYISWRSAPEDQDADAAVMGPRERLAQAKAMSRGFADPLRSAYEWLPDDLETVYWTANANWDPSLPEHAWDNHGGLATLAGDAAHPMTYHRGQGLNHAIDDAGKIVKLLSSPDDRPQSEIIGTYEDEMRARTGEEVRLSEMNSSMVHDWSKLLESPLLKMRLAKGGETAPPQETTIKTAGGVASH